LESLFLDFRYQANLEVRLEAVKAQELSKFAETYQIRESDFVCTKTNYVREECDILTHRDLAVLDSGMVVVKRLNGNDFVITKFVDYFDIDFAKSCKNKLGQNILDVYSLER